MRTMHDVELDTKYGGFFINSGDLELVKVSEIYRKEGIVPDGDTLKPEIEDAISELAKVLPESVLVFLCLF